MTATDRQPVIAIIPASEWDMRGAHGIDRITVQRVTRTHVQYAGPDGKRHSKALTEFVRISTPTGSTIRAQSPRREPPLPPAALRTAPVSLPSLADELDIANGISESAVSEAISDVAAPVEPTEQRKTPSLSEAVARDWDHGHGLKWKELQDKYHVGGTRLKQILIPYGYVSRDDRAGALRVRAQKAHAILAAPMVDREALAAIPPETVPLESHVVTVTPAMSAEWLERKGDHSVNRPVNDGHVQNLAAAMRRGEWRVTGEAIKLDVNGCVRDGQHRLWACIESGKPFRTLVVINVPDDAFDVMDTGRVRTAADILSIHGLDNAGKLAPAARLALTWEMYGDPTTAGRRPITSPQVLQFIKDHPEFETAAVIGTRVMRAGIPGGPAVWSCIVWKLSLVSAHDCEAFVQGLTTGINLGPGHPILALRNRVLGSRTRMSTTEIAAVSIKAWNMWRRGQQIQVLIFRRDERFPTAE